MLRSWAVDIAELHHYRPMAQVGSLASHVW